MIDTHKPSEYLLLHQGEVSRILKQFGMPLIKTWAQYQLSGQLMDNKQNQSSDDSGSSIIPIPAPDLPSIYDNITDFSGNGTV